jgi:hypothetical protein
MIVRDRAAAVERAGAAANRWSAAATLAIGAFALADFGSLAVLRALTLSDALLLTASAILMRSTRLPRIPGWYWIAALTFAVGTCLSQFLASPSTFAAWMLHCYFYLAIVPLVWMLGRHDARIVRAAVTAVFVVQAIVAAELIWRIARGHIVWWQGPAVPLLGNVVSPLVLVVAAIFGAAALVDEWISRHRLLRLSMISAGVLSVLGATVLSNKRTSWAELIVATTIFLLFVGRRPAVMVVLVLTITVFVGAVATKIAPEALRQRFETAAVSVFGAGEITDVSYSARALARERVLRAFERGPWTQLFVGYGYRRSPEYVGPELVRSSTGAAHNTFVNYLGETGLFGVLPLLTLWLAAAWTALTRFGDARHVFHRSRDLGDRRTAILGGACGALMAAIWIELLFAPDIFLRLAFLVYGMLMALSPQIADARGRQ